METGISGAYFVNECNSVVETVGPDGLPSEKILFADTSDCDATDCGTPIFGTQNVKIWGNIVVYIDLAVCDSCGRESTMTVCAEAVSYTHLDVYKRQVFHQFLMTEFTFHRPQILRKRIGSFHEVSVQ